MVDASVSGEGYRGLETGTDRRVTEAGDNRLLQNPNAAIGTLAADGTLTAFVGAIHAKSTGAWQVPVTYANDAGTWKAVDTAYYHDTNVWKRIL